MTNNETNAVDVLAEMQRQRAGREAMRMFPRTARKPRKTIKQSDVDAAVNASLDALAREFRRLGVEFPKFRQAYDIAVVTVQNARRTA